MASIAALSTTEATRISVMEGREAKVDSISRMNLIEYHNDK